MKLLTQKLVLFLVTFFSAGSILLAHSQTKPPGKLPATATITGRVTVNGKARSGIVVGLRTGNFGPTAAPVHNATTDADGGYRIEGVLPGRYVVAPMATSLVLADLDRASQMGKPLVIAEGDAVQGIDFAMLRGSVITGKVTDADGRPIIEERVIAIALDQANPEPFQLHPGFMTDDRGVYRIFGLRAGRYKVAVGESQGEFISGPGKTRYQRVYYPNVANTENAKIIELAEGEQATNVDITIGEPVHAFTATGRIVIAETNQPLGNAQVGLQKTISGTESYLPAATISNANGEFRLENISAGTYSIVLMLQNNSGLRADPFQFQIVDQDVSGLLVSAVRGATITGTVVVEGTQDQSVIAKVHRLRIYAWIQGANLSGSASSEISADGGFRLAALAAGNANLQLETRNDGERPSFVLSRIERDGIVITPGTFEVKAAEQISGVRLVLTYAGGSVRGTVSFENGPLRSGTRFVARLRKTGESWFGIQPREVDTRGHFLIEGVPPGTYDLTIDMFDGTPRASPSITTQSISVTQDAVTEVAISVDLARAQ